MMVELCGFSLWMTKQPPLTDNEAHDLLLKAVELFTDKTGQTVHAETVLRAAQRALFLYALALLKASEDENPQG